MRALTLTQTLDFTDTLEIVLFPEDLRLTIVGTIIADLTAAFFVDRVLRFVFGASTTSKLVSIK